MAFNWLIAGTDAHAKNYSLLIGAEGRSRLAPLYDITSILPYDFDLQRARFAMKIGGEYRLRDVGPRQWQRLAADLRLDRGALFERLRDMARALADNVSDIRRAAEREGLDHPLIARLSDALVARARRCLEAIDIGIAATPSGS